MRSLHWLSISVASLLLLTGCPSRAPQKQKVQYASVKSPPDYSNASSPAQPDKNLKIQKITLVWNQPGKTNPAWSYKLHQGPAPSTYTNSVITLTTNAVVYVWPSKTYYFDVILITDILDSNGLQETVHCENPYELVYTVPNKPGGPK